jgi:hypothetical protein
MARHPAMVDPRYAQPGAWDTVPLARQSGLRWRLLASICLCLLVAGWLAGLTRSGRGWLTIGLAELLVILLAVHHRDGGRRWLARVVCEYAVVAALAMLLLVAGGGAPQPAHQPSKAKANAAGQLCPAVVRGLAGGLCDRLDQAWQQAKRKTDQQSTPSTTTPSRKHHR